MNSGRVQVFSIPSSIGAIDEAVQKIAVFAAEGGFGDAEIFAVDMASRESVANAVKHGNRLDESKPVDIELRQDDTGLTIEVRDHGAGFDTESLPDPTNPENLLKSSGRGVLFMRNFMDEVSWRPHPGGGTVVSMLKRR